jgi:hypothetical protein
MSKKESFLYGSFFYFFFFFNLTFGCLANNLTPPLLTERGVIFTEGFSVRRRNEDEVACATLLLRHTPIPHTTHLLDLHTLISTLRTLGVSEVGYYFFDSSFIFLVDSDLTSDRTSPIFTDTIVVRLTVSISLYECLYVSLAWGSDFRQLVYRHYLVIMVACGRV